MNNKPVPKSEHIIVKRKTEKRTHAGNILWEVCCSCGKEMLWSKRQILDYHSCGCRSAEIRFSKVWKGCGEVSGEYFSCIRKSARDRNLDFEINVQDIWEKFVSQDRRCALSNEELHFGTEMENQTASLDRIDSSKGYTVDNIQWLHKTVNFMKQQYKQKDFLDWCRKIVQHNK